MVEAAVTFEVVTAPRVAELYFWALQASFADGSQEFGAAHTGLQWNPSHPGSRAVNWGGYASPPAGGELSGTHPALPGRPGDQNTRDYSWRVGVPYRFRIRRGAQGWASEVSQDGGPPLVLRELFAGGDRLSSLVVWAELFSTCEVPAAEVAWSDFETLDRSGRVHHPTGLRCNFPNDATECRNTDAVVDGPGRVIQRHGSGVVRTAVHGAILPLG